MTTAEPSDGAAVRFPFPPLLFLAPLAATLALHRWVYPLDMPDSAGITVVGIASTVVGIAFTLSGVATVIRHHSTVVPHRPVARLVLSGPYRISRNPMYAGQAIAYAGVALWAGSWWPLFALPFCILATYRLVIVAEEDYLTRRFGTEYARYRHTVRRWL